MTLKELNEQYKELVNRRPELKEHALDLIYLCMDEIKQGGSEQHEIQLASESIKQLELE